MNSTEVVRLISEAKKKTIVKAFLSVKQEVPIEECKSFYSLGLQIIIGDYEKIKGKLEIYKDFIMDYYFEVISRNQALEMLNILDVNARIEPGAIIRNHVEIGDNAVIMMGAILNIGAKIGAKTMIDMGAIIGANAIIGDKCHIGAGAVIAGVIEPPSAKPVIIEDNVLIGANAVILEGIHIGQNAVVGAGAVVISDVECNTVVGGVPARVLKMKDELLLDKTRIIDELRG